jgi:hypothetical protein
MSITMRIMQQFDAVKEREFLDLERKFAQLERERPDFPKGKRMQPISASEPCNTLIWEYSFKNIQEAYDILDFFSGDAGHETLLEKQLPFFKQVRIEFYRDLDY